MIHYIHCHQGFDMNKGGTVGYLSSLLDGMERIERFRGKNRLQHAFLFPDILPDDRLPNIIVPELKYPTPFEAAYEEGPHLQYRDDRHLFHTCIPASEAMKINVKKITSVHIHGAYNFLPVYNFLRLCGIENDVVKILTTHNPWKPSLEDMFHLQKNMTLEQLQANRKQIDANSRFLNLRDDFAFRMADALFFPHPNSMDGYYESWPEFKDIVKNKRVYFSLTGTEEKSISLSREVLRKKLNIPKNDLVFLFLGRFIPMRGFDKYVEAAKQILSERDDVWFLAVGEDNLHPAIDHPHWMEIGFTNTPGDYINAADACISANRGSFFDLSMIEMLSIGTPLIASKVGGYKYLEGKTTGVHFFEKKSEKSFVNAIRKFITFSKREITEQRRANKDLYASELTPECFASGYVDAIDNLYEDFSIKKKSRTIARLPMTFGNTQEIHSNGKVFLVPINSTVHSNRNNGTIADKTIGREQLLKSAKLAYEKKNYRKSIEILNKCVDQFPEHAHTRRVLAEALIKIGSHSEAMGHLSYAHKLLPENGAISRRLNYLKNPFFFTLSKGKKAFDVLKNS